MTTPFIYCIKHIPSGKRYYGDRKKAVARVCKTGGTVICFGWNSGGIGKTLGFELVEVLLVPHGGAHNDTIVTVEKKFAN